ncbi:hypothetical protein HY68_04675 [Streptomyces sp. AcH 505]|uniref:DUF3152 domain-containing protein n=1 Tax=Streptomyces sp. AcH 505 TaxID=352211 RepID=UPI0005923119|nr:hypothetical protein HY68_04675 [Streptomyces sp. AcH 505]
MGRHSRKGPVSPGPQSGTPGTAAGSATGGDRRERPAGPLEPSTPFDPFGPGQHTAVGHGAPQVRGGHPEQREPGGGWGSGQRYGDWQGAAARPGATAGRAGAGRLTNPVTGAPMIPGPRREFVDAFDTFDAFDAPPVGRRPGPTAAGTKDEAPGDAPDPDPAPDPAGPDEPASPGPGASDEAQSAKGGKGRTFTGIAAAAVTTVLAIVVAGQVADGGKQPTAKADGAGDIAARAGTQTVPPPRPVKAPPAAPTYTQLMAEQFPLSPKLKASGRFTPVSGAVKAPGKGEKFRYRVDIENGLGLDGALFADAVQKTLNDDRSWAHDGAKTFERISTGRPDFVITLASPGTTAVWCAKSGLDTTEDNVSCDSASTDRVMINAFRWAQGSKTFGAAAMYPYRQMLINHEVGHRLGHSHVTCRTPGALAPVMQQQTKSLDIDGIKCRPNPWVFPKG